MATPSPNKAARPNKSTDKVAALQIAARATADFLDALGPLPSAASAKRLEAVTKLREAGGAK